MNSKISYIILFFFIIGCQKIEFKRITKVVTNNSNINGCEVTLNGDLIDISDEGIDDFGLCWGYAINPTINDNVNYVNTSPSPGEFSYVPIGLIYGNSVYSRAFSKKNGETIYGELKKTEGNSYNTNSITQSNDANFPDQYNLNITTNLSGLGSLKGFNYGHCWSYSPFPTINDTKTSYSNIVGDSSFNSNIPNLIQSQTLYVRSYISLQQIGNTVNNLLLFYSDEYSKQIQTAAITTNSHFINGNEAVLVGTVTQVGIVDVADYGHCWSKVNSNPNISNSNLNSLGNNPSLGDFNSTITLTSGNTYYYRSYFQDDNGQVIYGNIYNFNY